MKTAYIIIATILVIASIPFLARFTYKSYREDGYTKAVCLIASVFMSFVIIAIICALTILAIAAVSGSIWVIVFLVQLPLKLF